MPLVVFLQRVELVLGLPCHITEGLIYLGPVYDHVALEGRDGRGGEDYSAV